MWSREKEWEEEILRALKMLLEVDSTALTLTETLLTVCGEFRLEACPTEMRKLGEEELLLPLSASSSDLLRLMENFPGMPTGHSLSCWR